MCVTSKMDFSVTTLGKAVSCPMQEVTTSQPRSIALTQSKYSHHHSRNYRLCDGSTELVCTAVVHRLEGGTGVARTTH